MIKDIKENKHRKSEQKKESRYQIKSANLEKSAHMLTNQSLINATKYQNLRLRWMIPRDLLQLPG
jgi:hypothetical protein